MPFYGKEYIHTTIHDFKANIAKYIRVIHSGRYKGIIVKRYNEPVGLFVPLESKASKPKEMTIDDLITLLGSE